MIENQYLKDACRNGLMESDREKVLKLSQGEVTVKIIEKIWIINVGQAE